MSQCRCSRCLVNRERERAKKKKREGETNFVQSALRFAHRPLVVGARELDASKHALSVVFCSATSQPAVIQSLNFRLKFTL